MFFTEIWIYFFESLPHAYIQYAFRRPFVTLKAHPLINLHRRWSLNIPIIQHHLLHARVSLHETRKLHLTDFEQPLVSPCFQTLENFPPFRVQFLYLPLHVTMPVVTFDKRAYLEVNAVLLRPVSDLEQFFESLRLRAIPANFFLLLICKRVTS